MWVIKHSIQLILYVTLFISGICTVKLNHQHWSSQTKNSL